MKFSLLAVHDNIVKYDTVFESIVLKNIYKYFMSFGHLPLTTSL